MFSLILTPAQLEDALVHLGSRLEKWAVEFKVAVARNGELPGDVSPPLLSGTTIFVPKLAVPEARASLLALLARIHARSNHRDASQADRALAPVLRQVDAHRSRPTGSGEGEPGASIPVGTAWAKPHAPTLVPLELGPAELRVALGVLGSDLHHWRNAIRGVSKGGGRGSAPYDGSIDGPLLHEGTILVGWRHLGWVKDGLDVLERQGDTEASIAAAVALSPVRVALARLTETRLS